MEKKQIIKPNEDCDAEYFLCSWFDINSIPKHNMILPGHDICELMEEYHRQKSASLIEPYKKLVEAQDELITFYGGIIDSSAMFLHVHHWEESTENIEKGRNLRDKIGQLKKELK